MDLFHLHIYSLINRGGENIYPREVEMAIEALPQVKDVAVIGIRDEALGEKVKAFITLTQPDTLTEEDIKSYLREKIAKYKIPEVVEFVADLPRNPTGKILKKELKRMEEEKNK